MYWHQINNDKISALVCFSPLSSLHCSPFITQLVPPCSVVSCQQKEKKSIGWKKFIAVNYKTELELLHMAQQHQFI